MIPYARMLSLAKNGATIQIDYTNQTGEAALQAHSGRYLIQIFAIGTTTAGNFGFRAFCYFGQSFSNTPFGWKLFLNKGINNFTIIRPTGNISNPPSGYNPSGDAAFVGRLLYKV